MKKYVFHFYFLVFSVNLMAQPYMQEQSRHRFAQLNFGADFRAFSPKESYTFDVNQLSKRQLNTAMETRLIIGGTHFWGHADFYIAFPIISLGSSGYKTGAETGLKVYPWRIENKKIRPFVGVSWMPNYYKQGDGTDMMRHSYPLLGGFTFSHKNHLFEVSVNYNYKNRRTYYLIENQKMPMKVHPLGISLGYKFMLETTLSAERDWKSGRTKKLTELLSKNGGLNGFTISVGPSSAIFLKSSSYLNKYYPFLDNHKLSNVFPEFGLGYYLHKPDVQFNLVYRSITSEIEAFDFSQKINRKALNIEAYKFIADYHGFAPFIGMAIGKEWFQVNEDDAFGVHSKKLKSDVGFGVVFGWDIRPNRLQAWYLRTHLRWYPYLKMDMLGNTQLSLSQLEFNFIQLVLFPERLLR